MWAAELEADLRSKRSSVVLLGREDGGAVLRTDGMVIRKQQTPVTGYEPTDIEVSVSDGTFPVIGHGYDKKEPARCHNCFRSVKSATLRKETLVARSA